MENRETPEPVPAEPKKETASVQSVGRALTLLRLVAEQNGPVPLARLCATTGLNRTTVWRLMATLESHNFIERDPVSKDYELGFASTSLCTGTIQQYAPLVRLARPAMERLWRLTQESVLLSVPRFSGTLTVDQLESPQSVRLKDYVNTVMPLYCTSNGKVLLAHLPEGELEAILQSPLRRLTPHTITDPALLRAEVRQIAREGYGTVFGELDENENGISVPLLSRKLVVGFLNVSGPGYRFTREKVLSLAPRMLEEGALISRLL